MLLLSEGEFPVVLDGCGCGLLFRYVQPEPLRYWLLAGVSGGDDEAGGGWASGDVESVA